MKSPAEIKDAHDLLARILMGHHMVHLTRRDLAFLQAQYDVCCFFLECEGNGNFQGSLDGLKDLLSRSHTLNHGRKFRSRALVE